MLYARLEPVKVHAWFGIPMPKRFRVHRVRRVHHSSCLDGGKLLYHEGEADDPDDRAYDAVKNHF